MPRKVNNALTPLAVKNAKPGRHADGSGLHLLVKESGARSWVYRFMLNGKSRDVGLGAAAGADALSLADARDAASALRLRVRAGVDPLAERQREAVDALAALQAAEVAGITFNPSPKPTLLPMRKAGGFQTPAAVAQHARNLRLPCHWRAARRRSRDGAHANDT